MRYSFYQQRDLATCGPTCLKMTAKFYGNDMLSEYLLCSWRSRISLL